MQRPNNAGGPGNGLWTTAEMGLGSGVNTFTGQNTLQHPATHFTGRDGIPVLRYASINPSQTNPLHFRPGWGQPDPNTISQQPSPSLWNTSSSGRSSDQSRSLLGTEQWGRESGGAPWGSSMEQPAEAETSPTSAREPDASNVFRHRVTDSWLNPTLLPNNQEKNSKSPEEVRQQETATDAESPVEGKTRVASDPSDRPETSSAEQGQNNENKFLSTPTESPPTHEIKTNADEENTEQKSAEDKSNEPGNGTKKQEDTGGTPPSDDAQPTSVAADSAATSSPDVVSTSSDAVVAGTIDQIQQINLMDSYHQTIAAAQLTSYQLAMQQQYAQQLAAAPGGMLFPGSYIVPAQANPAAYTDPATGQIPVMAHYSPYPGWPATAGVYPAMLQQQMQQQMAAVAASVTSQQSSSPSNQARAAIEPSRGSISTARSPPQSPSIQQDSNQSSQSDLLANVAAVQQSNLNAMAMASYGIMPSAYYDQTGALIINNNRAAGPVRLFAPSTMLMNGSQAWIPPQMSGNNSMFRYNPVAQQAAANAMYANQQNVSGGSTPVPSMNQSFNAPMPNSNFGSSGNISNLGVGPLNTGLGSNTSTPQRKDSFSDYGKLSHQHYGNMSQFYNSLGVSPGGGSGMGLGPMSSSPGPLSNLIAQGHHGLNSPPQSMSPSNMMHGTGNRIFSAAPGAEAKYRNGQYMSSIGNSGSSLFPPTRIRSHVKEIIPHGRSKLLDDFRNNRLTNPVLHELTNHIVEFSQDQHGSRFIQQKLERASPAEKQQVFSEIISSAYHLMTDVFGNYVIQKFFEFGSQEHKMALADCIHGHVLPLALQMYGCRVIQKALECIPPEKQVEIVQELDGHLLKCVKDQNGNHVVQKCIECVPPSHLQFIVDGFKGQVVALSSHPYGCRVMQRILEHCTDDQTAPILDELHQHTEMLVQDQYGNYVIQHVLEHGQPEHKHQMINELRGKILALSQHKFASNVIEKCVSHSSVPNRAWLIDEVCQEPDALFIMMKDQYANYVVQKMLDLAEPQQKKVLIHKIRPHVITLRKFTYGKHIITKLEKFFQKSAGVSTSGAGQSTSEMPASQHASGNWGMEQNE